MVWSTRGVRTYPFNSSKAVRWGVRSTRFERVAVYYYYVLASDERTRTHARAPQIPSGPPTQQNDGRTGYLEAKKTKQNKGKTKTKRNKTKREGEKSTYLVPERERQVPGRPIPGGL